MSEADKQYNKNGKDIVGFNALPSNWGTTDLGYNDLRSQAYCWMQGSYEAIGINADNKIETTVFTSDAFIMSVRCIKK